MLKFKPDNIFSAVLLAFGLFLGYWIKSFQSNQVAVVNFKVGDCVLANLYGKWEIPNRAFKLIDRDGDLFQAKVGPLTTTVDWYVLPTSTYRLSELEDAYRVVACP